jgi:multicomponent Na+:H+ antiporter subunit G
MILDVLAAVAVVGGSTLAALGAIGLLRFPDVFTRMHAATKVATVGVIATTAAAAIEAGAVSGVLVLLLVVALLFLSGPLGMSLLARAAYHDPETPRAPNTRELGVELPIPESTSLHRTGGTSPFLALWLFLAWIALFGSLRPNVVVGGVLVAGVAAAVLRGLAPRWPDAFLHPVAALRFTSHFTAQLLAATWDVVKLLGRGRETLEPAVVEVPLLVRTRNEVTLLMNAVSFTPGTVALEIHHDRLYLHMLSTRRPETVVEEIGVLQRLIMEAFGDPDRGRHPYHATDDV